MRPDQHFDHVGNGAVFPLRDFTQGLLDRRIDAQVTNYRCIDDSEEFSLSQTTCLVGKNESGKTTLLRALEKLNPLGQFKVTYDKTMD